MHTTCIQNTSKYHIVIFKDESPIIKQCESKCIIIVFCFPTTQIQTMATNNSSKRDMTRFTEVSPLFSQPGLPVFISKGWSRIWSCVMVVVNPYSFRHAGDSGNLTQQAKQNLTLHPTLFRPHGPDRQIPKDYIHKERGRVPGSKVHHPTRSQEYDAYCQSGVFQLGFK